MSCCHSESPTHPAAQAVDSPAQSPSWRVGTPTVSPGRMTTFWCLTKESPTSPERARALCYANGYLMGVSDSAGDPPEGAIPVGDDGDYSWTGWFEGSCQQCDTYWTYSGEVVAWMELPTSR